MTENSNTSSAIIAEAVSGSHVLKIDGFSRTMELLENGNCMTSITLNVGGHSWIISYYPNGCHKENADSISLYLVLDSTFSKDVKAKFKFGLLDKDGVLVPSFHFSSPMHNFASKGSSWGYGSFIKKEELEESVHLRDDCFTIRCDITVMKEIRSEETKPKHFVPIPASNLHQHLGELLKNMDGSDVTYEVGGERFPAHRCVLAARSSVFKAELLGDMAENSKRLIQIEDMDAHVFKSLLHFIYTDALPETAAVESNESCAEEVMAQHLLVAADRYNIERLKLICEGKLCRYMNSGMVATSLALADQHNCDALKEACFEFLSSPSNLEATLASDGFEHLKTSCPSVLKELIARFIPHEQKAAKEIVMAFL